jgi:hypothetical protein
MLVFIYAVIDDKPKESIPEHDAQISSIRWHLSEGSDSFVDSLFNICYVNKRIVLF